MMVSNKFCGGFVFEKLRSKCLICFIVLPELQIQPSLNKILVPGHVRPVNSSSESSTSNITLQGSNSSSATTTNAIDSSSNAVPSQSLPSGSIETDSSRPAVSSATTTEVAAAAAAGGSA